MYFNEEWCHPANITVKEQVCTPHAEVLCVSARPFYIPREFSHVIITAIYIPPEANEKEATDLVYKIISNQQTVSPDALFLLSGDFNRVTLKSKLPTFQQCVNVPTRKDKTIDLFYTNVKGAYKDCVLQPLGLSDHNLVHLQPKYCPLVKRERPQTRFVKQWTDVACEELKACFESTDWSVFTDACGGCLTTLSDTVTEYINFCVDSIIPIKKVKSFANNKPWMTSEIYELIKRKKRAFLSGSRDRLKEVQKDLKKMIRKGKAIYRKKIRTVFG